MAIKNAKDLGEAIKKGEETIEIEGDLKKKVLRIKAIGKVAWAVAIGAIGVAVASILMAPATAGTSTIANFAVAPVAISTLGAGAASTAISIAVAAGGVGALNKLRKYKVIKKTENKLILKK